MATCEITHIEFPADDVERAKRFYSAVAGWEFNAVLRDPEGSEIALWESASPG